MRHLKGALSEIRGIFRRFRDKREAHRQSFTVLAQISREPDFLREALECHVAIPQRLNTLNYPSVAVEVETNPDFAVVLNCWIPLPSYRTDVTTTSIHHHGDMLLTTTTLFGPGYEHWMLSLPQEVGPEQYTMRVLDVAPHPRHHVLFVDSWTCHVPLYPESLSITLALWSNNQPTSWRDRIKRSPLVKGNEAMLRKFAASAGLKRMLDLKVVDSFDFYPGERGFKRMKQRVYFPRGSNQDYLHSLFHVIQRTGNEHISAQLRRLVRSGAALSAPLVVEELTGYLEAGRPIEGRLSPGHYDVPYQNFTRSDIERALASFSSPEQRETIQWRPEARK